MMKRKISGNFFFYILFCLSLVLTWYFHKDATHFSDRSEMWSDKAGYYIYLPATFFYHFDARRMPADLDVRTGGGFAVDTVRNRMDTKYTYGVSLMASPFFVAAGVISRIAGYDSEHGFSMIYMRMMSLAAVVYLMLGLWFLKRFLEFYFKPAVAWFVILAVFSGTNLFYYSLIDGMMSHVYSFFLFSLFLFSLKKYLLSGRYSYFVLLSACLALAVLIRPTNFLLVLLLFFWDAGTPGERARRAGQFLKPAFLLVILGFLFAVFLPQLVYWKYLSGHWLHFSYRGEGFVNRWHPQVAAVLFSPLNGLFAYTPLALVFVAGIFMMLFRKKANGWLIAVVFAAVTLICASWKMWYFGCSYGQRPFIEYYAILAVPFGWLASSLFETRKTVVAVGIFFLVFFCIYVNLRFTCSLYRFERCYYGSTWDCDHYLRTIERSGIISPVRQMQSFENDFENLAICPVTRPSQIFTRSGLYSIAAEKGKETPLYTAVLGDFGYPPPKTMKVDLWAFRPGLRPTGAELGYALTRGNDVIFSDRLPIDSALTAPMTWAPVSKTFIIPDVNDSTLCIHVFLANPRAAALYADDLHIGFRYHWSGLPVR